MHVTDGRTDRQTNRILIARPRLHYMQRSKNFSVYITQCHTFKTAKITVFYPMM